MSAFQTALLPHLSAGEIKRLNHISPERSSETFPEVGPEIERAFAVAEPVIVRAGHAIHLVGEVFDALLNVRRWNGEILGKSGAAQWGSAA